MNFSNHIRITVFLSSVVVLIVAIILSPSKYIAATRSFARKLSTIPRSTSRVNSEDQFNMTTRTPIYFLSHGGPNIMYEKNHPVTPQLQRIGREINQKVKPKAIVVFSAHWQGERDVIEINTAEKTDLIYDFYGFPSHYYKETFPNTGSPEIASRVIQALNASGIKTKSLRRGLDHGVWASFKVAFDPATNPLTVPVVQVSLFDTEDPVQHLKLGQAIQALREENIQIVVSGMAVHNLRDMGRGLGGQKLWYADSFDQALKEAVESEPGEERDGMMTWLLKRKDARGAHPTFDHLLPIHVGVGAAGPDKGVRTWTLVEGSLSWAQYRFGDVPA